ncbi:hypothetical protein NF27_CG01370 [Candidatus Jidaibacter acanthamoeba]|uniref:DUF2497 domain-containing protein n=1 Tax=Candidatus Jidaibacter acanthamoebae TaxID=86105 RepID=A0A0C1MV13_9RICK|nr:DUF2497 domain-containing protein [Candidatus Jidaibacter acanthamoeba]KIE05957.1 hypothetical protein NF27_CG01370 [Candidatus Jidaibacter acanthamoeba]
MDTSDNRTQSGANEAASKIDEALQDIRKAMISETNVSSDILELTEVVEDGNSGKVTEKAPPSIKKNIAQLNEAVTNNLNESSEDILKKIDNSVAAKKLRTSPPKFNREDNMQTNQTQPKDVEEQNFNEEQNISPSNKLFIAEEVAKESQDLIRSFIKATTKNHEENINFRSGTTLEDLVIELLKPELSEWLNRNLPNIVKSIVEKEVKKLIPQDE